MRSRKRLGIVFACKEDVELLLTLARAAHSESVRLECFVMGEGVLSLHELAEPLAALGFAICVCESSLQTHNIRTEDLDLIVGSQDDHAAMVQRCDRVVALT